jgi:hypothetical protein
LPCPSRKRFAKLKMVCFELILISLPQIIFITGQCGVQSCTPFFEVFRRPDCSLPARSVPGTRGAAETFLLRGRLPITDYRLLITDYRLPITDYRLPLTAYRLPITDYRLPITDYRLPLTDYRLPITDYRLPITGNQSPQ